MKKMISLLVLAAMFSFVGCKEDKGTVEIKVPDVKVDAPKVEAPK